jgi:hypothetical protein
MSLCNEENTGSNPSRKAAHFQQVFNEILFVKESNGGKR